MNVRVDIPLHLIAVPVQAVVTDLDVCLSHNRVEIVLM